MVGVGEGYMETLGIRDGNIQQNALLRSIQHTVIYSKLYDQCLSPIFPYYLSNDLQAQQTVSSR